jgi:hypothetical protein
MSIFYCLGCDTQKDNDFVECYEHNSGLICEDCLDKELICLGNEQMISDYEIEINEGENI